ncbi:Mediator of RNA polymerase II transcription subunit 12 [Anopheles darlingi]|uniref:Mediator of RNA polymerase II transcription subunit 12 n=1 Tax=Anopheles darlingi TaxID=43151 RepID=W5JQ15_ANODA|nr:Mediator of RNA polymerase II transcription subunit 12 [Anopheles darlingi]
MNRNSKSNLAGAQSYVPEGNCVPNMATEQQMQYQGHHPHTSSYCCLRQTQQHPVAIAPNQLQTAQCQPHHPGYVSLDTSAPTMHSGYMLQHQQQQQLQQSSIQQNKVGNGQAVATGYSQPTQCNGPVGFSSGYPIQQVQQSSSEPYQQQRGTSMMACNGLDQKWNRMAGGRNLHQQQQSVWKQHARQLHLAPQQQQMALEQQTSGDQYFLDPNCTVPVMPQSAPPSPTACSNPTCKKCKPCK